MPTIAKKIAMPKINARFILESSTYRYLGYEITSCRRTACSTVCDGRQTEEGPSSLPVPSRPSAYRIAAL
jgi:hypothetical protein